MSDDRRPIVQIPGNELDKALGEVSSEAGKSVVRGFAGIGSAITGQWVTTRHAKAEAARLAIETQSRIDSERAVRAASREDELAEVEHRTKVELAKRRAERFINEWAYEQENLESIIDKSLPKIEADPKGKTESREFDPAWLFMFADVAGKISNKEMQDWFARILHSAAVPTRVRLSPAAIQKIGLLEAETAGALKAIVRAFLISTVVPSEVLKDLANVHDLNLLIELGFLREAIPSEIDYQDFVLQGTGTISASIFGGLSLTTLGHQIAAALFNDTDDLKIEEGEHRALLAKIVLHLLPRKSAIRPKSDRVTRQKYLINLERKSAPAASEEPDTPPEFLRRTMSARVWNLLCDLSPHITGKLNLDEDLKGKEPDVFTPDPED